MPADLNRTCVLRAVPKSTFTGFDGFTYSLVDEHGAESRPATVSIEMFEPRP